MPQGTLTLFQDFSLNIGDGTHDLDNDTYKIALITTLPTAADVAPALGNYTEVSGAGYTAGGETLTTTWTETGGVSSFRHTGGTISWTQNPSGPTNVVAGLIYNDTNVGKEAICYIDFTSDDGATPLSLQDDDITWTPEGIGNRIFTAS